MKVTQAPRLHARLATLESGGQAKRRVPVRVFWRTELVACAEHAACDLEIATGSHLNNVLHLRWTR